MRYSGGFRLRFEHPKNISFRCERCAMCCGDTETKSRSILLLKTEADRISRERSLGPDEFAEETKGYAPYLYQMRKTEDGKCIFLREGSCLIYEIRPLICRFYPFELRDLGNGRYAFGCTNECQGIGKGPQLKKGFFEKLFRQFRESMSENTKARAHVRGQEHPDANKPDLER